MTSFLLAILPLLVLGHVATVKANCPRPFDPDNGRTTPPSGQIPFPVGSEARVFCNQHYKFDDRGTGTMRRSRCQSDNRWSRVPECKAIRFCPRPRPKSGGAWQIVGEGPGDQLSDTRAVATFRCPAGHFLAGRLNRSLPWQEIEVACNNNLEWEGRRSRAMNNTDIRCLASADCNRDPGDITHGNRTGSCCGNNDVITYSCNSNYFLIGEPDLKCVNGKWNHRKPSCTDSPSCRRPRESFGTVADYPCKSQWFQPRESITYSCKHGYFFNITKNVVTDGGNYGSYDGYDANSYGNGDDYPTGETQSKYTFDNTSRTITCSGGRWNKPVPVCRAFECEVPSVANGEWNTNRAKIRHGEAVTISCNQNYVALGPASIKCDVGDAEESDGWNLKPPTCKEIRCAQPINPEDGFIDQVNTRKKKTEIGSVIRITCYRGYQLDGSKTRTCRENGRWSGTDTTCQPTNPRSVTDCPVPVKPFGGRKVGESYNTGDRVTYSCSSGLVQEGPDSIRCNQNGQWTPSGQPDCRPFYSYDNLEDLAGKLGDVLFDKLYEPDGYTDTRGRRIEFGLKEGMDITFLIDSSGSITIQEFNNTKRFVKLFAEKLGVSSRLDGVRIAVASFAADPENDFSEKTGFHTNAAGMDPDGIDDIIDSLEYKSGDTNINGALKHFKENMLPINFKSRQTPRQYLFVLSDGKFTIGGSPVPAAENLKSEDKVEIFCVKVGNDKTSEEADKHITILKDMSSEKEMNADGGDPHFFHLKDYETFSFLFDILLNGSADYSRCGIAGKTGISLGKIIGGNIAKDGAWPWMAALFFATADNAPLSQYKRAVCGGTVLDREWILTAAHCFGRENFNKSARTMVKIGANNLTQTMDEERIAVQDRRVRSIHIHPSWVLNAKKKTSDGRSSFAGDIALIRLKQPIEFSKTIRPICLAAKTQEVKEEVGVVTGWGRPGNKSLTAADVTNSKEMSNELRQVRLPVVTLEENPVKCPNTVGEKIICAGDVNVVKDSCKGDSGGPLMIQVQDDDSNDSKWLQIGIVSNGVGCADPNQEFGRYTDVREYLDWIEQTTGINAN